MAEPGQDGTAVSPPPVYYRYSVKAERVGPYNVTAHVYSNDRNDAIEQLGMTVLEANERLKTLGLPPSKKVKE